MLKVFAVILALGAASPALADDIDAQDGPEEPDAETAVILADEDATTENAVIESSDAFGTQVGQESTGLYSAREVRGFNPVDAGNVRIASLYYDQLTMMPQRLRSTSTIRVGLGTMGFAFPAPTGLVDYALRSPGDERRLTIDASTRHDGNEGIAAELQLPRFGADSIGVFGALALRHRQRNEGGPTSELWNGVGLVEFKPTDNVQLTSFVSLFRNHSDEPGPTYFLAGEVLPPKVDRRRDLSQEWADSADHSLIVGNMLRAPLGAFSLEAGLFFNQRKKPANFVDLFTGMDAEGNVAERFIIADAGAKDSSWSGELRVGRAFAIGATRHQLSLSLRGRDRARLFGGSDRVSLGASTILAADPREKPDFDIGEKNRDNVRQLFAGVAYSGNLTDWLRMDLGASKIDYSKKVDYADPATPDVETTSTPIAWNASLALALSRKLTLFGSLARGMEEADVAPDRAVNRAEAPAAIDTRQEEVVLSYSPVADVTVLAGLFRISKPYHNLDPDLRYRLLGTVVNQGVEISAVARPVEGLTMLGGAVISEPEITGEIVESGTIGPRPLGQPGLRVTGNVDWRFDHGESPLSLDLAVEHIGSQPLNALNSADLEGQQTVNLGMRYRFDLANSRIVFRGRLDNVFDTYSWSMSPGGSLRYNEPRSVWLQFIAVI